MEKNFTKLFVIAILSFVCTTANAQTDSIKVGGMGKNLLKVNLTALPLNNYSIIYERAIGRKISLGLGFRYMPEDNLPLLDQFESIIDDEDTFNDIKDIKTGNFAITPEVKFYFGKGVFRGFYIAPFVRYAEYTGSLPFEFEYEIDHDNNPTTADQSRNSEIDLDGKITAITGGLLFGAQWKLSKLLYLNWEILGPSFGSSKGNITGTMADLSDPDVQEGLREELKELEDSDIPLVEIKTSVNDKEAKADFSGPWAGVRASIGIGFRF
ncbi:MAG: DUF3575 domain-containing protein [Sphingobacteriaceae bacterium]